MGKNTKKKVMEKGNSLVKEVKKIILMDHLGALILGFLIIYGLLAKAGTLTSGFHFLDDHELIRMELGFTQHNVPLGQAILNWMDFHWRFRPFYWVERVTGAYLWGSELLYWNYYTAIKGVLAFYCLYMMSRYLKYNRLISAIVPCVVMLGSQFTPWYRSANQESTGLLFCAISLCLIAAQAYHRKYTDWRYNVPIVISAILCGLMKESFTLFLPVFVAIKFWLEYWQEYGHEKNAVTGKARFLKCMKSNAIPYGCILLSMLINVCLIVFYVGVDKVSYAGFQEGVPLSAYIYGIRVSLSTYTKWYTLIGALIVLLAIVCYKNLDKKDLWKYFSLLLIGGGACAVQLVAHAKSAMWERYIFPYIIGYVLVFVLLAYRVFEKDKVHRVVFIGILFVLLYKNVPTAYQNAQNYAHNGQIVGQFLEALHENTEENDQIICAFGDEELNLATESWLEANNRTQAYSFVNGEWKNIVQIAGTAPAEYSVLNAKAIACYTGQVEDMLRTLSLTDATQYTQLDFEGYSIVIRK